MLERPDDLRSVRSQKVGIETVICTIRSVTQFELHKHLTKQTQDDRG